jgi:ADP-ribose diphosphatase
MELVRRIGERPDRYRIDDCCLDRGGFLSVYSFALDGKRMDLMDRGHGVVVLPVDWARREVYMIEQPRPVKAFVTRRDGAAMLERARRREGNGGIDVSASELSVLEMPAGMIDAGESPAQAASRELAEETGIVVAPESLRTIAEYFPSVGGTTERMTAFFAELPSPVVITDTDGDGHERIDLWKMTFDEAWEMMRNGRIETASSMVLLRELKIIDLERAANAR